MRPLAFVKYYEKASTILRADQVAEALRRHGASAVSIEAAQLGSVRDHVLVFIKTSRLDHLALARARRNLLVLDVHDTLVFKRRIKNRRLFDGLIFTHARQLEDFGDRRRVCRVIPMHADPRFGPHRAGWNTLEAAYFGDRRSLAMFGRLPGVECFDSNYFEVAARFNCHLSVREPGLDQLYKPAVKVAVAAACGALLITTADCASRELLGDAYPYYTDPDRAALLATLERARAELGGATWRAALEQLAIARERTRLERAVLDYVELFGCLEKRAPRP
jgi:hypothetical protein